MLRTVLALLTAIVATGVGTAELVGPAPSAVAAEIRPVHSVSVSGVGVEMYPGYHAATERYAVTTTEDTGGSVTVHATTSDLDGRVWVNGRAATTDAVKVTGLGSGDEISVIITDSSGTARHSLVYLPAGFPKLRATTNKPGVAPGLVGLTLSQWNQPTPNFEAAVDVNGVPVYVHATTKDTLDLKRQPNGHYSVARTTTTPDRTGHAIVELDSAFREVARHETVGIVDTDGHDSILQPDGSRIHVAYEPNAETGMIDAVIQELDPQGSVVFEWRSNNDEVDLAAESVLDTGTERGKDYAHINSVFVMKDGDILASFRHLSSVLKIARTAHDGFEVGDIVWRLGGRRSDFTFADDPYPSGPCAQHTASELPNGNILIYDNGSGGISPNMCVDPQNPNGAPIARTLSRVTEYDIGTVDNNPATRETATLVWDYEPPGRFGFFAGSAQRLPNGNTLVGWAVTRAATATEVDGDGDVVWELKHEVDSESPLYSTYRALKFPVPDRIDPKVRVELPAKGTTYPFGASVEVDISCTDRGGSTLQSCGGTASSGDLLDTWTSGKHTFRAVATDGAGNTRTVTRTYTVAPDPTYRPDGSIRVAHEPWVGNNVYGGSAHQRVVQRLERRGHRVRSVVRVQNDGRAAERLRIRGTAGSRKFRVAYLVDGNNVTRSVREGTFRTSRLAPGQSVRLMIEVTRTKAARPGDQRTFVLRTRSTHEPTSSDAVAAVVRATR